MFNLKQATALVWGLQSIMNKINNAVIKTAKPQTIKDALASVFSDLEERVQKILVEKILGVYEDPIINPTSTIAQDALLEHYNPISGMVTYTYTNADTRYFETQDEADKFAAKGVFGVSGGFGGCKMPFDSYKFEATHTSTCTNDCCLDHWNACQ